MISVAEAAGRLGVSRHRVYARLREGSVRGQRSGSSWLVDASSLTPAHRSRPMSPRMALALSEVIDGRRPAGLFPAQLSRLREKADLVASQPTAEVLALVRSWLAARAATVWVEAAPADIASVRDDSRLALSGLSDPRSGLAVVDAAEGYIARAELPGFADDHFFDLDAGHEQPNIFLHVLEGSAVPVVPTPRLLSAADLIDHGGPREAQAALRLLGRA